MKHGRFLDLFALICTAVDCLTNPGFAVFKLSEDPLLKSASHRVGRPA